MDTTKCIENKLWELYSEGKLSVTEKHQLDQHVVGCEICMDIKEGIDAMANPSDLKSKVRAIDLKIENYVHPTKRSFSAFWFSVAAAVFLFAIGLSWILFSNKETEVAIKTIENVLPIDSIDSEKVVIKTDKKESIQKQEPVIGLDKEPTGPPQIETVDQTTTIEEVSEAKSEDLSGAGQLQKENKSLAESDIEESTMDDSKVKPTESTVQKTPTWAFGDGENKENSNRKLSVRKKATKSTSSYKSLPAPVNNSNRMNDDLDGNYSMVNDSLTYNKALNYYQNNNYDSCLITLTMLTSNNRSTFFETSNLLKAKALIKINDKDRARGVLQIIIRRQGKLMNEAKELLNKL